MKSLNGSELAGFIKERQAKAVRGLRQADNVFPKLAIVQVKDDPVINTYVRLKHKYGQDVLIDVDIHRIKQKDARSLVEQLNTDESVHGIIIQLPLENVSETDELCNMVDPGKDVDALGQKPNFDAATPTAILWLLAGYNVELAGKKILLIGRGKLVGAPLERILKNAGHEVTVATRETTKLNMLSKDADVIITAAGSPALLFPDMIKEGAVVVDAGVASEDGRTVGDLSEEVYERDDLTVTPVKGGVGPLTVCALFENVIIAARRKAQKNA
jgi:methylenetetrahydrofolate dehydrogenase (NADP+) / methenyltetrahydrofolate cyclohydrolase